MVTLLNHLATFCQWGFNSVLPSQADSSDMIWPSHTRSIVIVCPYFIGDTLLASTLIQNIIRQVSPETAIYVVAEKTHLNLLATLPGVTACIPMPHRDRQRVKLLRDLQCEVLFLLRHSLPWGLSGARAGVPYRIGFDLERYGLHKVEEWGGLLTHASPSGTFDSQRHQIEFYREMCLHSGLHWHEETIPKILLSSQDLQKAKTLLEPSPCPRFVIHLTAGSPGKSWPMRHWIKLLQSLNQEYHPQFIALGRKDDADYYEALSALSGTPILNLCGQTTLRESAAVCRLSDMVITLDTALAHIAAAVKVPRLVVIYGPTNPKQWKPIVSKETRLAQIYLKVPCRPCITRTCYHRSCLTYLTPLRVLHHIHQLYPLSESPMLPSSDD